MSSRLNDPAKLLVVLSILFAVTLGGAPPSSENEVSGEAGAHASAVVPTVGPMISGMGPIPLDVRLYTLMPNTQEEAPFSIQAERILPLPDIPDEAAPAMATEPTAEKPAVVTHVVRNGETAWDIAKAYGVDVDTILGCNDDLPNVDRLKVGQELKILTVKGVLHTVRQGESLWEIAKDYKVDVDKIVQANDLVDPGHLQPKQELVIPGAKPRLVAGQDRARPIVANGRLQKAFEWPVQGRISSRFGPRWGRMHEGLDIAVNTGTPVKAAAAGKVSFAGWNGAYGYLVKIDHGNGVETRYAHNSRLLVKAGDRVTAGQVVARSGNTGRSTGPHVHFEIRLNGRAYNPLDYLR